MSFEYRDIDNLKSLIESARHILITCHLSPDGDALGSSLGLYNLLVAMGKKVKVIVPDTPPKYLMFLPGAENIMVYGRWKPKADRFFATADLVFCLDFNELKRVDEMADTLGSSPARKVMIDHHLHPADFPDLLFSYPEVSSTSMLIYKVINALGWNDRISVDVATAIYTGMMTDTGNFSYNSNSSDLYLAVADLIAKGIDKDAIYKKVYYSNSVNRLRLNGFAMCHRFMTFPEHKAALITLTRSELNEYHYQRGDTEDLVNRPLTVPEIIYSVFMREEEGYIKVSTRSKGDFPVNEMCKSYFNGGGHLNAAGGEFNGTLEEAVDTFQRAMVDFDRYLPQN